MSIRGFSGRISGRWLWQPFFWIISGLILLHVFGSDDYFSKLNLIYTLLFLITLAIPVYLNLYLLIPWLLSRKRYLVYLLSVLTIMAAGSGLNMVFFGKMTDYLLPGFYFISYYDFADLLVFFAAFLGLTTLIRLSEGWFDLLEARRMMAQLEKEVAVGELSALRNQVHPHFFFNSLNSIYALARKRSDQTSDAVMKLSGFMRYLVYETNTAFVALEKEISMIGQYLDLQRLRSDQPGAIQFTATGDPEGLFITPLLLLPLVENSFKHGANPGSGLPEVEAVLEIKGNHLRFLVSNPEDPGTDQTMRQQGGVGIVNLKRRLELIYPDRYTFQIRRENNIFTVLLEIELDGQDAVHNR